MHSHRFKDRHLGAAAEPEFDVMDKDCRFSQATQAMRGARFLWLEPDVVRHHGNTARAFDARFAASLPQSSGCVVL